VAENESAEARREARNEVLELWAAGHDVKIEKLDDGQKWVIFAALAARDVFVGIPALLRLLAYVLAHCGMDLSAPVIAAVASVSDRAIRTTKALSARELLESVRTPPRGRGIPKLGAIHVGAIAKLLFKNPKMQVHDILEFCSREFGIDIDRKTLRMFVKRYGLATFRDEEIADTPLFSEVPATEVPSS
jgi:hypothetical protein